MFGKKKSNDSTVLLLDIESGSIAGALLRLSHQQLPKLISFQREPLPLTPSLFSDQLTRSLEKTLEHSLNYTREVAGRMRVHASEEGLGVVARAVVFLAAPWGVPNLSTKGPEYLPGMREFIKEQVQAAFGDISVSFYTGADAVAFGSKTFDKHVDALLTSLRGEMIELLLMSPDGPKGYSTLPLGSRSVVRTLQSHGALTQHEAHSMITLGHQSGHMYEPLVAAGRHLSEHFASGVKLLVPAGNATSVVVLGEHPLGEWFAHNLADDPKVSDLFSEDSTVEALRQHHLSNYIMQGKVEDPFILLESIFVDSQNKR